jgi:ABC-type nickel/cobalt efflux system permease component RcnA
MTLIRLAVALVLIAASLLLAAPAPPALAEAAVTAEQAAPKIDRSKLLVQPREAAMPAFADDPAGWILAQQKRFYGAMSRELNRMRQGSPFAAALMLMALSFAYGVLHAAGPGHGKAVVSAWLLGNEQELHRGIQIAFMSSLVQAVVAIGLVSILIAFVGAASAVAQDAARWLEAASFLAIAGMGAWLCWQALRSRFAAAPAAAAAHAQHAHPHGHAQHAHAHLHGHAQRAHAHHDHHHHHGHHHHGHEHQHHEHRHAEGEACDCGHAHIPAAAALKGDWSWTRAWALAVAVGIRPCTGALLVLVFSSAAGLYWAGVVSTLVMALGTAITVSALAALAVGSRKLALRFAGRNSVWLDWTAFGLKFAAGAAIVFLGLTLFWGTLNGSTIA